MVACLASIWYGECNCLWIDFGILSKQFIDCVLSNCGHFSINLFRFDLTDFDRHAINWRSIKYASCISLNYKLLSNTHYTHTHTHKSYQSYRWLHNWRLPSSILKNTAKKLTSHTSCSALQIKKTQKNWQLIARKFTFCTVIKKKLRHQTIVFFSQLKTFSVHVISSAVNNPCQICFNWKKIIYRIFENH